MNSSTARRSDDDVNSSTTTNNKGEHYSKCQCTVAARRPSITTTTISSSCPAVIYSCAAVLLVPIAHPRSVFSVRCLLLSESRRFLLMAQYSTCRSPYLLPGIPSVPAFNNECPPYKVHWRQCSRAHLAFECFSSAFLNRLAFSHRPIIFSELATSFSTFCPFRFGRRMSVVCFLRTLSKLPSFHPSLTIITRCFPSHSHLFNFWSFCSSSIGQFRPPYFRVNRIRILM